MARYYLIPKRVTHALPWLEKAAMWIEAQMFRVVFTLVGLLSLERASRLSAFAFRLVGPQTDKAKKVRINLSTAFPDLTDSQLDELVKDVFSHAGASTAELLNMPRIWDEWEERIEVVSDPESVALMESGPAGVYVTAHVGAWQMTAIATIRKYFKKPLLMVYAPESNPYIHDLFFPLREAMGVRLIPSGAGVRPLLQEMKAGTSLGLAVDTRLATGKLLPFFGIDALTNTTPARLALRNGGPLVPVRGERLAYGKYRVTVEKPIAPRNPEASLDEQANDMSAQLNQRFEEWIRETPGQWLCMKRRWPKAHRL